MSATLQSAVMRFAKRVRPLGIRGVPRFLSMAARILWTKGPQPVEAVDDVVLDVDMHDYFSAMMVFGRFSPEIVTVVQRLLKAGDVAVDIGAHAGYVTALMARAVGGTGRVFSFDPDPNALRQLRETVASNAFSQVTVTDAVVSDVSGPVDFFVSPQLGWSTAAAKSHYDDLARLTVRSITLDGFFAEVRPRPTVKLVKIDVEGFEAHVLRGMTSILKSDRPYVIAEMNERMLSAAGSSSKEISALFTEAGYYMFRIGIASRLFRRTEPELELVLPNTLPPFSDVLAVPHERGDSVSGLFSAGKK